MKYLVSITIALIIVVSGFFIPIDTTRIILTPNVNKVLSNISDSFDTEMAVCLRYTKWGPFVITHSWKFPVILDAKKGSVTVQHCSKSYKMFFHNHPEHFLETPALQNYYYRFTNEYPKDMLYLSRPDSYFSRFGQYDYMVVGSGKKWAWWEKDQIKPTVNPSIDKQTYDF